MSDEKMTATERLRALLDERGVEWWPMHDVESGYREDRDTEFLVYGCKHVAHEWGRGLQVDMLTPEQAIAATLGRGTCRDTGEDPERFCCSTCGSKSHIVTEYRKFDEWGTKTDHFLFVDNPRFCPSCGRVVEREDA